MRCTALGMRGIAAVICLLTLGRAGYAEPVVQDVIAKLLAQTVVELQFNNTELGSTVLDFDARTNTIHEYRLVGSSFSIATCNDLVVASTNFQSDKGETVMANFVLERHANGMRVAYQSFGEDASLARIQTPQCETQNFGVPLMRPTTVVSESKLLSASAAN